MAGLYINGSSRPTILPWAIRFSDGSVRTDPSTFTEEEIALAGYVRVPDPPDVPDGKILNWTGTEWQLVDAPIDSDPGANI